MLVVGVVRIRSLNDIVRVVLGQYHRHVTFSFGNLYGIKIICPMALFVYFLDGRR